MDYAYIGCIAPWPMAWAPQGWQLCNGQSLNIKNYTALYSIIGTYYGGDGVNNFLLPNLNNRFLYGVQGYALPGHVGGSATVALSSANLPAHSHLPTTGGVMPTTLNVGRATAAAGTSAPAGGYLASPPASFPIYNTATPDTDLSGLQVGTGIPVVDSAGTGSPFSVLPPYTALNWMICITGLYPPRD